jgi:hypothetical protein
MAVLETLKNVAEKATGLAKPSGDQIEKLIRSRKANTFRFKDDGVIPNHAHWPFVFYRGDLDPAAIMEELFELNGWGDSWRNGIYDYVHYTPEFTKFSASQKVRAPSALAVTTAGLSI